MKTSKFGVGHIVHHKLFHYRGVVVDVDAEFSRSEEWYRTVAQSEPAKDQPWYRVLVDGTEDETYVAERNLELERDSRAVQHPELHRYFTRMEGGHYVRSRPLN